MRPLPLSRNIMNGGPSSPRAPASNTMKTGTTFQYPIIIQDSEVSSMHKAITPSASMPSVPHHSNSEPVFRVQKRRKSSSSSLRPVPASPTPPTRAQRRSASAPQLITPLSPEERYKDEEVDDVTADYIHGKITKYLKQPLGIKEEFAQVYIFQDPDRPSIIKIGSSQCPKDRMTEHMMKCRFKPITPVYQSKQLKEAHATKVEKLAHKELLHFRRRFLCGGCTIRHVEFFEIDWERARSIIERWIALLEFGLYGDDNKLLVPWREKINRFTTTFRPTQDLNDHASRHAWWEALRTKPLSHVNGKSGPASSGTLTTAVSKASQGTHKMVRQEWAIWCIVQAAWLLLSSSSWAVRNFIYLPHLIALTLLWVLLDLEAFGALREPVSDLRSWGLGCGVADSARWTKADST